MRRSGIGVLVLYNPTGQPQPSPSPSLIQTPNIHQLQAQTTASSVRYSSTGQATLSMRALPAISVDLICRRLSPDARVCCPYGALVSSGCGLDPNTPKGRSEWLPGSAPKGTASECGSESQSCLRLLLKRKHKCSA